ncbi:MAG: oxygen-independent coproporphyrinogen III oxidase [Woeseiaceae bacterium]|nr:oxygen-independent coproporphyrinogen III oxidase [Woeseiaceae bacterium]
MSKVRFDRELIQRYGGRGPRYTSYPTAPQFHSGFGESHYVERAIRSNKPISDEDAAPPPLSLYLHLPFCRTLCYYCGCTKIITRNEDRAQRYLDVIQKEAALHSPLYDRSRQVEQLHLGGGSPTFYSDEQLGQLMETLRREFTFAPPEKLQCSIEVDPRTVAPERIESLAALGFNRLSLGVQDFDEEVQAAVNRLQSRDETLALLDAAREHGFKSVSVDLIYGLPKQTPEKFAATLETVIQARPDRISLYSYAHMPQLFKAQKLIDESELPDGGEKLALLELSIETLCNAGYEYIGMDHFALVDDELVKARESDHLHRNFQGYSTHAYCDLVSLGASAIGHVAHSFYQNEKNTNRYSEAVLAGRLPIVKGLRRDNDDILRDDVIQDLMCQGKVDFAAIENSFDIDFKAYFADELASLKPLAADGLVRIDDDAVYVTPTGQLLLRAVAMVFDRYLREPAPEQRYSKVI